MNDRRKYERFLLTLPARLETITAGKKEMFELETRDISAAGAFIYTKESFPIGKRFSLDFTVPSDKIKKLTGVKSLIECEGNVVRSTEKGVALHFDKECQIMSLRGF